MSLTARIKELLIAYPEGVGVLRELVQNADDAGATHISFVLDHRSHGTGTRSMDLTTARAML